MFFIFHLFIDGLEITVSTIDVMVSGLYQMRLPVRAMGITAHPVGWTVLQSAVAWTDAATNRTGKFLHCNCFLVLWFVGKAKADFFFLLVAVVVLVALVVPG